MPMLATNINFYEEEISMRNLTLEEVYSVSGALPGVLPQAARGVKVIIDAANGDAPGWSSLTGTAAGPTPGNTGGRYPIEALGQEPSRNNIPGGELGRKFTDFFTSVFGG